MLCDENDPVVGIVIELIELLGDESKSSRSASFEDETGGFVVVIAVGIGVSGLDTIRDGVVLRLFNDVDVEVELTYLK